MAFLPESARKDLSLHFQSGAHRGEIGEHAHAWPVDEPRHFDHLEDSRSGADYPQEATLLQGLRRPEEEAQAAAIDVREVSALEQQTRGPGCQLLPNDLPSSPAEYPSSSPLR